MNKSEIELSVIIVSYNTAKILRECLISLFENSEGIRFEVIVVDNASTDNSTDVIKKLQKKHSNLVLIQNKENLGFTKANNIGVKSSIGDFVLFLNSDTVIYPGTLLTMLNFMKEHPEAGASTCYVETPKGKIDDASHRGFPTPIRALFHFLGLSSVFKKSEFFNGYHLGYKEIERIHEIEVLAGAFMFVRREAGEDVAWWDESYFWYGDDIDFCYRLKEAGWKIFFVPDVKILHYKGASGGIKKDSQKLAKPSFETRLRATNARFDAMKIFYKKHYRKKYPFFMTYPIFLAIEVKRRVALSKLK